MMRKVDCLVIGGGPSGLAVAYRLGGNAVVLEKEEKVGGLCRSICRGGGVFDIGGHSYHTPYPEVVELVEKLLPGGLYWQRRDAWVYTHGTLIPYPFQKFFDRLPNPDVVRECAEGLRNAIANPPEARHLEEYIVSRFGYGIAEHFMLPYQRKLWARDIKEMSSDWASERVAGARGENEAFETTGGPRTPLQADTQVGYPQEGGYEEICKSFVPHLPGLELNSTVAQIDPKARVATTRDGRHYQWRFLVSTIPLPVLVRIVEGAQREIGALTDRLDYMSLRVELLLAGRRLDTPIQRIYVADPKILAHKIALNHNSSDYLCRQPRHAIMAEVSVSRGKRVHVSEIAPNTIACLCELGILDSPDDIVWQGHVGIKYAYPVYTHARPAAVQGIKEWMARRHIYTVGRFGDWEYVNSDRCIRDGLTLGEELRERYPNAS